jgi:hypothetical protein
MTDTPAPVDISPEAVERVLRGSSFGIDRNEVIAMLRELRSALTASGWLPFATAPQDGTEFQAWLVNRFVPGGFWVPRCRYNTHGAFEIWTRCDYDQEDWDDVGESTATHWMPHPEVPK